MDRFLLIFLLFCVAAGPAAAQSRVVSSAESTAGWRGGAALTPDAYEGRFAVSYDAPGDRTGFLTFDHGTTGVDLAEYDRIAFWWKTEGDGLRDFKIKVRNHPIAAGMEAVYTIHDVGKAPDAWALAVVSIDRPDFDDWGAQPDLDNRYITFRTVTSPGARVRLFVDRIVAIPSTFTFRAGTPVFDPAAGPDVDFDGDGISGFGDFLLFAAAFGRSSGNPDFDARFDFDSDGEIGFSDFVAFSGAYGTDRGRWDVPVTLRSESTDTLEIRIGTGRIPIYAVRLAPGDSSDVNVQLPPTALSTRDPGDTHPIPLWAEIAGTVETRRSTRTFVPVTGPSRTWLQFREALAGGSEPILPDFSYAGYRYGTAPVPPAEGPVYDVTDFGAVPDDGASDHSAIQAAIDAAEAGGGGRVVFPAGRFLVNTDTDIRRPIRIQASDIVLQGAGSRAGGTVIRQVNHLPPADPEKLWSSPYLFQFEPPVRSDPTLASITVDARRETRVLSVDNSTGLAVGDRVKLVMTSTAAVTDFLQPYSPEPTWRTLFDIGIRVREKHTIADVDGRRVTLGEPIHTDISARYTWKIAAFSHIARVGVEDICFAGSWRDPFVHHRDAIHDGGWSLLRMTRVADAWIRRCSFVDANRPVSIANSAAVSVYQVTLAGNKGHSSIAVHDSYGVWVGLSEDLAGHHHGPGSSGRSTGTVYWRYDMMPGQRIDAHGDQPYANLLDCVNGGILYGSGAAIENFPNHLRHYTLWNFNHRGPHDTYDFWRPGPSARDRFVKPIVVGFHGDPVVFDEESVEVLESQGHPVQPESLFEAQMKLRLGAFPAFYGDLESEWAVLRAEPLPLTVADEDRN